MDLSSLSYQKFVNFAVEQTKLHTASLTPLPSHERFKILKAKDNQSTLHTVSFTAPKIRLLRSLAIEGSQKMKVLDLAIFSEPAYDLPIFCANFFMTPAVSILVLDLNPLYDVIVNEGYKDKYYKKLLPIAQKYIEFFPWGGKITSESMRFFSPIVIWTTVSSSTYKHDILYSAFVDYFKSWLELMDLAEEDKDASHINHNLEAQHKYLTWRAEKDPGYPILKKLFGESPAKDLVRCFLFDGVDSLGTKTFLDYFPEYKCADGKINPNRSARGKLYETRPWSSNGEFISSHPR